MPAKSKQQIAMEFGVCTKTLNRWLKDAGLHIPRGYITPLNQRLYQNMGKPGRVK